MSTAQGTLSSDEQRLAELGYKQELKRGWSSFSNFAISFSIISVLAALGQFALGPPCLPVTEEPSAGDQQPRQCIA